MKILSNKKYNVILKYVLIAVVVTLLLIVTIFSWDTVRGVFASVKTVLNPVIWGAIISFIMNPIMMATEKFLNRFILRKKPRPKIARAVSVVVATLVFIVVILAIILSIIPEIISNLPGIYTGITEELIPAAEKWAKTTLNAYPSVKDIVVNELSDIGISLEKVFSTLVPQLTNFLTSLLDFANSVKNFALGIMIAIYFLFSKETLQAQAKKLVVATCREETYHWIFNFLADSNSALLNFIYGKVIDSIIIGVLCCICMLIFNMPYAMIVSIIIGITNIVPIFGPFIGAIPSAILILIAAPGKVIWFVLFIIALQQLDGNFIGPKILGSKIGISTFWMLISLIVFGSMFGIMGMIIGVPLFAVFYDLVGSYVNSKLSEKNMPTDNSYYSMPGKNIGVIQNDPESPQLELDSVDIKEEGKKREKR